MRADEHGGRGGHITVQAGGDAEAWGADTLEREERSAGELSFGQVSVSAIPVASFEVAGRTVRVPRPHVRHQPRGVLQAAKGRG